MARAAESVKPESPRLPGAPSTTLRVVPLPRGFDTVEEQGELSV